MAASRPKKPVHSRNEHHQECVDAKYEYGKLEWDTDGDTPAQYTNHREAGAPESETISHGLVGVVGTTSDTDGPPQHTRIMISPRQRGRRGR